METYVMKEQAAAHESTLLRKQKNEEAKRIQHR